MLRIRCEGCRFIRVQYSPGVCRACHKKRRPLFEMFVTKDGQKWLVDGAWAARRRGSIRGAQRMRELGKANKFTSETGRKAVLKTWRTRWRFNKRINARIGRNQIASHGTKVARVKDSTSLATKERTDGD